MYVLLAVLDAGEVERGNDAVTMWAVGCVLRQTAVVPVDVNRRREVRGMELNNHQASGGGGQALWTD